MIDTEGTTNDNLMAGLFAADIVVVPVYFALDDVTAAIQITDHYIPLAVESRGRPLPAIFVLTKQTIIDGRARALSRTARHHPGQRHADSQNTSCIIALPTATFRPGRPSTAPRCLTRRRLPRAKGSSTTFCKPSSKPQGMRHE